jgi:type II secretion system protein G
MNKMIQRSKKNLKNRKGFTLIELIVVIAILGILAAILIPRFSGFQDRAHATQVLVEAKQIATAMDGLQAEAQDGKYPTDKNRIEALAFGVDNDPEGDWSEGPSEDGAFTWEYDIPGTDRTVKAGRVVSGSALGRVEMIEMID